MLSKFAKIAKENPNSASIQKLSQLDLSNISKILPELLEEIKHVELMNSLTNFYNAFNSSQLSSFVPWEMSHKIKDTTIKLSVKYPRLQIPEIAEKCESPKDCVIVVIKEMIKDTYI